MEVKIYLALLIPRPIQKDLMEVMLAVVIFYLDGRVFYVVYVIREIPQPLQKQQIFAINVVEGFKNDTKKYKNKNMGLFYAIRKSMWVSSKRR